MLRRHNLRFNICHCNLSLQHNNLGMGSVPGEDRHTLAQITTLNGGTVFKRLEVKNIRDVYEG